MLFHRFPTQEARKATGTSAWLELQFCRLSKESSIEERVSVDRIENWKNDSLYIGDENTFYREYHRIFDGGFYNNRNRGVVDLYGINYYPPSMADALIAQVCEIRPSDHEVLLDWLEEAKGYNGFYILGI